MIKGYVGYVSSKEFNGKVLHSFKLDKDDTWYNTGAVDPQVVKGGYVEFEATVINGRTQVAVPTLNRGHGADSNVVATSVPSNSFVPSTRPRGAGGFKADAAKDQYWQDKEKRDIAKDAYFRDQDKRIQYQSARNAAIELTTLLVSKDLLKLPANNKEAAVVGKVDDLTERFYEKCRTFGSSEPPDVATEPDYEDAVVPYE